MAKRRLLLFASLATAGLSILFLLFLTVPLPAIAQSAPDAPDAPGSIAGTVTAQGGMPLAGMEVLLYQRDSFQNWLLVRSMATDPQGDYRLSVLAAGTYRVGFQDPAGAYARTFYDDSLTFANAADIAVIGNDVTGINATLMPAGAVTGIYSDTHLPTGYWPNVWIAALTSEKGDWQAVTTKEITSTGVYTLNGLQPGVYRICAFDYWFTINFPSPAPTPKVCYDDIVSGLDNAQPVTITAGTTATDIDVTAGVDGDGAIIGGVVRATSGESLEEITVSLTRILTDPPARVFAGATSTDASGHYEFRGLVPSDYLVAFYPPQSQMFLTQYYSGATTSDQATPVTMVPYEERHDIDATLQKGGFISGTIRVLGQKPSNAYVSVLNADGSGQAPPWTGAYDYATGNYQVAQLQPGLYRVCVEAMLDLSRFSGCYGGSTSQDATTMAVDYETILANRNIDLGIAGYDGELSGRVTVMGLPLANIDVTIIPSIYSYPNSSGSVTVKTDTQGRYMVGGLNSGVYAVGFSDPTGVYAFEYFSNSISLAGFPASGATLVWTDATTHPSDVDADLEKGGALSGKVTTDRNKAASNVRIGVHYRLALPYVPYDPFFGGPGHYFVPVSLLEPVVTDINGEYRIQGLPPGVYHVCIENLGIGIGCFGGSDSQTAKDVAVEAGATTTGIDIYVGALPERTYLPAVARE